MADKRVWMRAAGAGLMGGLDQYNKNRVMAANELKEANLNKIMEERNRLEGEQLGLMDRRLTGQESEAKGMAADRATDREEKARDKVQLNFEKLDLTSPENEDKMEYYTIRESILEKYKGEGMGDPEAMQGELDRNRETYAERVSARTGGTPAAQAAYKKRLTAHVNEVESFFDTANSIMGRSSDRWKDSGERIEDFIYMPTGTRDSLAEQERLASLSPEERAAEEALGKPKDPLVEPVDDTSFGVESILGRPGQVGNTLSAFFDRDESLMGGAQGQEQTTRLYAEAKAKNPSRARPYSLEWYRRQEATQGGGQGTAPVHRDLQIDPNTGQLITPGAGLPSP